jgi:hypothetical protein
VETPLATIHPRSITIHELLASSLMLSIAALKLRPASFPLWIDVRELKAAFRTV